MICAALWTVAPCYHSTMRMLSRADRPAAVRGDIANLSNEAICRNGSRFRRDRLDGATNEAKYLSSKFS